MTIRYELNFYHPETEALVMSLDLTDAQAAALAVIVGKQGGPDLDSGCWAVEAYIEPYNDDEPNP